MIPMKLSYFRIVCSTLGVSFASHRRGIARCPCSGQSNRQPLRKRLTTGVSAVVGPLQALQSDLHYHTFLRLLDHLHTLLALPRPLLYALRLQHAPHPPPPHPNAVKRESCPPVPGPSYRTRESPNRANLCQGGSLRLSTRRPRRHPRFSRLEHQHQHQHS